MGWLHVQALSARGMLASRPQAMQPTLMPRWHFLPELDSKEKLHLLCLSAWVAEVQAACSVVAQAVELWPLVARLEPGKQAAQQAHTTSPITQGHSIMHTSQSLPLVPCAKVLLSLLICLLDSGRHCCCQGLGRLLACRCKRRTGQATGAGPASAGGLSACTVAAAGAGVAAAAGFGVAGKGAWTCAWSTCALLACTAACKSLCNVEIRAVALIFAQIPSNTHLP